MIHRVNLRQAISLILLGSLILFDRAIETFIETSALWGTIGFIILLIWSAIKTIRVFRAGLSGPNRLRVVASAVLLLWGTEHAGVNFFGLYGWPHGQIAFVEAIETLTPAEFAMFLLVLSAYVLAFNLMWWAVLLTYRWVVDGFRKDRSSK
jgi:hypothetical protein